MKRHNFVINKTTDGKFAIALRIAPDHHLARFDTKKAAQKRLNQYLKNVKENA